MVYILFIFFYFLHASDKNTTINFKNLQLVDLVKIVSEKTNKNILITNPLKGSVDFISSKPLDTKELFNLLKISLENNGYRLNRSNNIYHVVKKLKKVKKRYIKHDKNKTEVIYLKYINSKELKTILETIIKKRDYKNKPSISINKKSNLIILDGKASIISSLKNLINKLDISKPQIYIKARIIEVDDNLVDNVGIRYGILGSKVYSGGINSISSNLNSGEALPFDIGNIGLTIPNLSSSLALGATINLLNKTYALDIISEPSILCLNNKQSKIYVGETISIQTASTTTDGGTIKNSFDREDVGLTLKVKPRVIKQDKVIIDIDATLEGIKNIDATSLNPNTTKKLIQTSAIVNNGESVILGGLIQSKNEKSIEKIPLAGDIPLIGELFKNRLNDNSSKNLTIILTPYIIPENKDLSFIRKQLSKIQLLEDELLKEVLIKLKKRKDKSNISENKTAQLHRKIIQGF